MYFVKNLSLVGSVNPNTRVTIFLLQFSLSFSSNEERAEPGSTAIPGQPVAKVEQAPDNFA